LTQNYYNTLLNNISILYCTKEINKSW